MGQVTVDDGAGGSDVQLISVTVTDANDNPTITSGNTHSVAENTTAVTTVTATDPDGDPLGFSISGGSDAGRFSINATTGAMSFITAPNFEVPSDANGDNVYLVDVTASDGNGGTATIAMTVTVTDANDPPVSSNVSYTSINSPILNVPAAGVLTGDIDEDGDPLTAVLVAGPATGTLTLSADGSFTFAPPNGFDGTLQFSYVANDGTTSGNVATVTIVVTPGFAPPAEEPQEEPAEEEAAEEEAEEESAEEETTEDVVNPLAVPTTPPASTASASLATLSSATNPSAQTAVSDLETDADQADLEVVPFSYEAGGSADAKLSSQVQTATSQVAGSIGDGLAFVLDTLVWQDLDELKKQVDNRNAATPVVAGTTAGVSSVVTAGYVLWTIRGGWLVSSLLAQMPAWQLVDPLLILDSLDEEELLDDEHLEENKKVEDMFEEQVKAEQ